MGLQGLTKEATTYLSAVQQVAIQEAMLPEPSEKRGNSTKRRTQSERVAESDRRMLAAALRLIGERGYRGTSLAAIGEAAGYSRGLVHERYGSKAGLLWTLVKHLLRGWNLDSRARGLTGHAGIEAVCDLLDNHRRAVKEDRGIRAFYALMFEALGPVPELLPEFRGLHREFRTEIEKALRAGIDAGLIRADIDVKAQAVLLLALQRGIAFQWLLDPKGFSLDAAYEELKRDLRRTLAP
ncbi:MAG: TetR/AcrR family transcriptional regulator [Polyangiales bacterium]